MSQIAERLLDRTGAVSVGCPSGKRGGPRWFTCRGRSTRLRWQKFLELAQQLDAGLKVCIQRRGHVDFSGVDLPEIQTPVPRPWALSRSSPNSSS
jgi:hypothetical protein